MHAAGAGKPPGPAAQSGVVAPHPMTAMYPQSIGGTCC